jgi:hypothetical protein
MGAPLRVGVGPYDGSYPPSVLFAGTSVDSISPSSAPVGGADVEVTVTGVGFTPASVIVWNGGREPTTFVSSTELTTTVKPSTASGPSTVPVGVSNALGTVDFTFTAAAPATGATAGTPGTFTPAGSQTPANVAALTGLTASPATAWATGQYVQTATPLAAGQGFWDGAAWVAGKAP